MNHDLKKKKMISFFPQNYKELTLGYGFVISPKDDYIKLTIDIRIKSN